MGLPDSYHDHLRDAEERLKMVKEKVENGFFGPDAVQMHVQVIGADLALAANILSGALGEEALNDRIHIDLGPG